MLSSLSGLSGYSIRYLEEKFHKFLDQEPLKLPIIYQSSQEETLLLIDGLWLKRGFVLMAYRQSKNLNILHISVVGREAATKIIKDLKHLVSLGYRFTGIVSDGGTGIVKVVNGCFPSCSPSNMSGSYASGYYYGNWKISKR